MATIVIVEDEGILAMKIEIDLVEMGHEVVGTASSATRAFMLVERYSPDIVLMDIALHGTMNGVDAAVKISEQHDCQIIYMTAHTDANTIMKAQKTKHAGFLHKPFEPLQLQLRIDSALEK